MAGRGPGARARPNYKPSTGLGRVSQDELDLLAAAVYGDLKGAGGMHTVSREARDLAGAGGVGAPPTAGTTRQGGSASGSSDLVATMASRLTKVESTAAALKKEVVAKEKEILSLKRELMSVREEAKGGREQQDELEVLKIQNSKLALQVVEMTQFLKEQGYEWIGSGRVSPLCRGGSSGATSPRSQDGAEGASRRNTACSEDEPALDRTVAQGCGRAAVEKQRSANGGGAGLALLAGDDGGTFEWGDSHKPRDDADDADAGGSNGNGLYFSLTALKAKVSELNLLMSEKVISSESCLADGRKVMKFTDPPSIEVVLYSDGICVERGVFRPYAWPLCRAFLDDILDGYFPYEYQAKYPDGMVVKLYDKTDTKGIDHAKSLGAQKGVSGVVSIEGGGEGYRVITKDTFLSRVPKTRITASGKIVNVRDDLAKALGVQTEDPEATAVADCTQEKEGTDNADGAADATVLLQVRIVGGGKLVAKLYPHSTIGDVRDLIAARMPPQHKGKDFELLTAFPRVTFSDPAQTLENANLVPNAALLMRVL